MDHVPSSIPLTTSPATLKLLVSPSSSDCGLCLDPISDDTDYAMLTSCSHVFCISCAEEWFTNNSCCPTCRVSKSYWLPRKLVQSYQRYREANPELLVIQEEIPIHLLQVLSPLLKVN
ncbi:RING-H2 finger protein ATL79-like [Hyalella azteca]|uniref:RING-H2 finger protein ATL79-like n=1 Tax=Hyalella azteca TaxID=294128 RepID=A0A8B7P6G9_HYAAZ|nr:RING-H2 finger protein ATL79-like [Hyalella azteca]